MIPITVLEKVNCLVVHRNCPDGTVSAIFLKDVLPDAEVIAVQYGPERDALEPAPGMLFCDMTPPPAKVAEFVKAGAVVLDHHKGAREIVEQFGELGVYADAEEEPGVSGALLAFRIWRQLKDWADNDSVERVRQFARLAGIRDCWLTDQPLWVEACAQAEVLSFYPLDHWLQDHEPYLRPDEQALGKILYTKKLQHARDIASSSCLRLSPSVAIFNADGRVVSDVAEALREVDPQVTLLAGFFYTLTNGALQLVYQLRSSPGAALTARQVAVANGGGGHESSAGFVVSGRDVEERSPIEIFRAALNGVVE